MLTVTAYNCGQGHQPLVLISHNYEAARPTSASWPIELHPLTKQLKGEKKGKGRFSLNIFLPLNTSITCSRVSRDIPLYPLARTLILSANSMRVLSGVKGFPTPETVTEPSQSLTRYQQGQKRETPSNLSLPAECERTKFTWSSLQERKKEREREKKKLNLKKIPSSFIWHETEEIPETALSFNHSYRVKLLPLLPFLKRKDREGCTCNIPQITVWDDSPGKLSKTRGDSINNCKKCTLLVKEGTWWSLLNNY